MTTDKIELWAIPDSENPVPLGPPYPYPYARELERLIAGHPEMIEEDLTAIPGGASQFSSGPDMLAVDSNGRLVLVEFKYGGLTSQAFGQALAYASEIEEMSTEELGRHLSARVGASTNGSHSPFEEWYSQHTSGLDLEQSRPVRVILAGVSKVDDSMSRITEYLSTRGIDISLVSFQVFENSGTRILARKVAVAPHSLPREVKDRNRFTDLMRMVRSREEEWPHIKGIMESARSAFSEAFPGSRLHVDGRKGLICHGERASYFPVRLNFQILNRRHSTAAIEIGEVGPESGGDSDRAEVRVIFFGGYVDLIKEEFERAAAAWQNAGLVLDTWDPHREAYGLETRPFRNEIYVGNGPVNFPRSADDPATYCPEVKFCVPNVDVWEEYRDMFVDLARSLFRQAQITPVKDLHLRPRP